MDYILETEEGERFKRDLSLIMDSCYRVKFLMNSRKPINRLSHTTERPIELYELSNLDRIHLLKKKVNREILDDEVQDLINFELDEEETYPILHAIDHNFEKEICSLEEHPLITLMSGNPSTITSLAPMLQNKGLAELYKKMLKS